MSDTPDQLAVLKAAMASLAAATTVDGAIRALLDSSLAAVGAASGALWLLDGEGASLEWAGGAGIDAVIPSAFGRIPMTSGLPATDVVRTGEPVAFASLAERNRRWPQLAAVPSRVEAVVTLPLTAGGRTLGCLSIGFEEVRPFDDEEDHRFLAVLADQTAIAIDRARLFDAEREARGLLEFLVAANRAMSGSLDPTGVLTTLSRLVVPQLADWSAAYTPRGCELQRTALTVRDRQEVADRLVGRLPIAMDSDSPVARSFRFGSTQLVPELTPEVIALSNPDPEFAQLLRLLTVRSGVALPVVPPGAGAPVAVLTLAFWEGERTYTPRLVECVEELCARAGAAIDTATQYQRQRRTATALTEAVLPRAAAQVDGVRVAARYLPVDVEAGDVGGDWFDSWALPDGRLVVGIGDVAGHGLDAATRMALFRHAARACALEDADPAALLTRLNRLALLEGEDDSFATALYGVVDPAARDFTWASAGHPPPVWLSAGAGHPLHHSPGPPLGAAEGACYARHSQDLTVGDMVILYTDGIVETPDIDLGRSIEAMAATSAALISEGDLNRACARLVAQCIEDRTRTDDCCVVVVRLVGPTAAARTATSR